MSGQKWLLLDFDNTIMATEKYMLPSLIARFNELYGERISQLLDLQQFHEHFQGQVRESLCRKMSEHFGFHVIYEDLFDAREWRVMQHLQSIPGGVEIAPGLIEALYQLQQKNWRFAVVSNNAVGRYVTAMRFAEQGRGEELLRFFGTSLFEAGDVHKPKPDPYVRAMQQLNARAADCIVVEDSITGVQSGVVAGARVYGYTGLAEHLQTQSEKLLAAGCVACFDDWRLFPDMIR